MKTLSLSGCRHALRLLSVIGLAAGLSCAAHAQTAPADLAPVKPVAAKAESENPKYPAKNAIDGSVNDDSRWVSKEFATSVALEIDLGSIQQLGGAHLFSGFGDKDAVAAFTFQFWRDGQWVDIPSATVEGNKATAVSVPFDQTLDVITNKIRLVVRKSHKNIARIKEIVLWPYTLQLPALPTSGATTVAETAPLPKAKVPPVDRTIHQIALNQIGYATGYAKRFTAPLTAEDTPFTVRLADGTVPLYRGVIRGGIGDFSDFRPAESAQRYIVTVEGDTLRPGVSDPFLIRPNLWQEQCWQPAVDFLIDTRSVVGTHPSAFGGCPWRDGNYYDAILPGLVLFYLADPARIEAMPRQIDWAADKKRVLDPAFVYDEKNPQGFGVMPAVTRYYNELEAPAANAPDVVKLLHWGAGFYLMKPVTTDPSGDPDKAKIHSQMVEQMAYIVWAWPVLKQWLPQSFYDRVRDFCFANWTPSLGINPWWEPKTYLTVDQIVGKNPMGGLLHPYKGRHAPGHSIVPNLLMHEVAKREGRPDAAIYLDAAVAQAEWIVKTLDWNDPRTTKGQRMSEHRTIPNLVWLLQNYPNRAPAGLKEKIRSWAEVAVRRSDNLWDFRRYDDDALWTIPKINDSGNVVGFPAIALAASWVIDEPLLKNRLRQLASSHVDAIFGRNPRLAAQPAFPEHGFPEIERGWPVHHSKNVCARLELCRGSLDTGPGTEMFPFNPEGSFRHREGWVNYGAAWCISLSYLNADLRGRTTLPVVGR